MYLYIMHIYYSSWVHLNAEITSTEHGEGELIFGEYFLCIEDGIRCLKFSSEIASIVVFVTHDSYEIVYISWSAEIGHHDIIDKIKPEDIPSEFDAFSVMVCDTFDTKWAISHADSLTTTEDKAITSREDFCAFYDGSVS